MRVGLVTVLCAAAFGAACAPVADTAPEAAAARQCFMVNRVRDFTPQSDQAVIVHAGRDESYELRTLSYCRDIDWAHQMELRTFGGTMSLCVGEQADVIVRPLGGPVDRCRVEVTRRVPAEASDSPGDPQPG